MFIWNSNLTGNSVKSTEPNKGEKHSEDKLNCSHIQKEKRKTNYMMKQNINKRWRTKKTQITLLEWIMTCYKKSHASKI